MSHSRNGNEINLTLPFFRPVLARDISQQFTRRKIMDFTAITFDQIALAAMACIAIREAMIMLLPDDIAGPGGWMIDTGEEEEA